MTLVRTALIALHHANLTGNYTVLRDLAAPDFREKNTAVDLGRIFAPTRAIDLGGAVLLNPNLSRADLTAERLLHVAGAVATRPLPVSFEFLFQPIAGMWRIYGIAVTPQGEIAAPAVSSLVAPPPQRKAARPTPRPPRPARPSAPSQEAASSE